MKKLLLTVPLALILCFVVGCQDKEAMAELKAMRAQAEVEEQNEELVKSYIEELNRGNTKPFEELCAPEYGYYLPSNSPRPLPRKGMIEFLKTLFQAFPDIN